MSRFFSGYPWRFIFTDLDCSTTAGSSPGLTSNRKYMRALGQASVIDCDVDPLDPRVHDLAPDLYPRVAPNKRLMFGFRREDPLGSSATPWVCRAAGICMGNEDEGDDDIAVSHITAYDPRKLLDARPLKSLAGQLPDPAFGAQMFQTGDSIVTDALAATIANDGGVFIDAGIAHGGTVSWAGTIETTAEINFTFQTGVSVGEVWQQVEDSGNCDIILTPIYDPDRVIVVDGVTYHFTHDLSIYSLAGTDRHDVIFGWDRLNRALGRIDRLHDGTPGAFFNVIQYYAGAGGPPVPVTPLTNPASISDFGRLWATQFFPSMQNTDPLAASVFALAQQALQLAKQGKRTLTLNVIPERAPIPLDRYDIGDRVVVHASHKLRAASDGLQRVQAIPFDIADDGIETVAGLITSPDYRTGA